MALTADQIAQIQQAVSGVTGGSGNSANQQIMQVLTQDGWDPTQVAALQTDGIQGNNNFTGGVPSGTWASQIQQALGNQSAATDPSLTPTPAATSNAAATANGGTASTTQQLQNLFQPTYLNTPASGTATTYSGSVSPDATIQAIYQQLNPQFAQANSNLNNQLAASGIEGGSAIDAQQQLQSAETGQLGSAVQNAITGANSLNQTAGLSNTSAQNEFNLQNLQNLFNTNQYNATAANTGQSNYANDLLNQYNTDASNYYGLNSAGLSSANGLASQGLSGSQNLAQNIAGNYQTQTGAGQGVANLFGQLGQYSQPTNSSSYTPTLNAGQDASYWGSGGG